MINNPEKTPRKNLTTTPFSYINDASVDLNLSLSECLIEFCEVTLWVLWCDHSNKSSLPLLTHGAISFFKVWENEIGTFVWSLLLAKFGSERVKWSLSPYNVPLSKGTGYCQWRFSPRLLSHENLHSLPEVVWRVFSPESTPLVIQQSR